MKKRFLISIVFASVFLISGQAYGEWAKTIRLYPSSDAHCVEQTKDGGYIILALHWYPSGGNNDFWVIKLNSNSDIEWQKSYGLKDGDREFEDNPFGIDQTIDGGYIIVGNSNRSKTWIVKLDAIGNIEWQKSGAYFSPGGLYDSSIRQTRDGGYALTDNIGQTFGHFDFGLMKLNPDGSFAWRGVYGNSESQLLGSLQITDDGGFIISGHTMDSGDDPNFSIVRIDSLGSIVWQKQYASDNLKTYDTLPIIRNTPDGGFIVGGNIHAYGDSVWIIKLDSNGNIEWQKIYYDITYGCWEEYIQDIKYTSDGNYIFTGRIGDYFGRKTKIWIVKIDSEGSILWDKAYTPTNGNLRSVRSIDETSDGGYIIGGAKMFPSSTFYDILLMKINANGDIPGCSIIKEQGFTVAVDIDGKAFDTNFSQRIITSPSIDDTYSSPIITNASSSYLCLPSNHIPAVNAGENIAISSENQYLTVIEGTASDPDNDALTYRWLEGTTSLSSWQDTGLNGEAYLNLNSFGYFSIGEHTLTLEVNDGQVTSSDDMILTISNSAPNPAPTGGGVYQIYNPVALGGQVSDFDKDTINYEWLEEGSTLFSGLIETILGGDPVTLPEHITSNLNLGSHTITLTVNDGVNSPVSSDITVEIIDTTAPTLAPIPNKTILWPPNHNMVDIIIEANASDNSGDVTLSAIVSSNEPEDGLGDGDMSPDWSVPVIDQENGTIILQLRSERSGTGDGRTYAVCITAIDESGNSSQATVEIRVPHDKGNKK